MGSFADQPAFRALELAVSERAKPILVWTGAGLSIAAGLPTWGQLKSELIDSLRGSDYLLSPKEAADRAFNFDRLARSSSLWRDFSEIKELLGTASFHAEVARLLSPAATATTPPVLDHVWGLRPDGVFTLNIDGLATRAAPTHLSPNLVERTGAEVPKLLPHLHTGRPFVANLHGHIDDVSSWIFTAQELKRLTDRADYRFFVQSCLAHYTNIFVGLSVDDIAVGGHLDALSNAGLPTAPAYWITSRTDNATRSWAEERGIRVVKYSSANDHAELTQLLSAVASASPPEEAAAPPVRARLGSTGPAELPDSVAQALSLSTNVLRSALNARAVELLAPGTNSAYAAYSAFAAKYHEAIYRAWYVTTEPGSDEILGYKLVKDVARGGFGRVFQALTSDGEQVAVKVLLDEVRRDPALLASFRRGVRSMEILGKAQLPRMVNYRDATEIPALVVMDWIEGPSLDEAVKAHLLADWASVLEVSSQIAETLLSAHRLPDRVLHRDLRPANVMLRDFWGNNGTVDCVVLDFDLSWHRGAAEHSIVFTTASGFLAPEQHVSIPGESTRHATVDSFGLGMTLYYLLAGKEPAPNIHVSPDWPKSVRAISNNVPGGGTWRSLPHRFARVIVGATQDRQALRWDMSRIVRELQLLRDADLSMAIQDIELVAEEIAARSESLARYEWDADDRAAVFRSPTGVSVRLRGDPRAEVVEFSLSWDATGKEDWSHLKKYLASTFDIAKAALQKRWTLRSARSEASGWRLEATTPGASAAMSIDQLASDIDRALAATARMQQR